ncbi:hypothetical protein E1A91_A05G390100v1 [Gossypium mustelinum]|uniref:Uncharacterized protein n=1 Tax=Gossypium mustelinum TaxID=34275 RepID=A0A5D2ZF08_GOSMU|nr:hypothetical protein E1A91_A05G390100v1 [Gossypium mustelinum]
MGAILNEGDKAPTTLPETVKKANPKIPISSLPLPFVCSFVTGIYVGFGSVTDVGTDVAIVVGGGAHDAAKWGSRREGQLLCC